MSCLLIIKFLRLSLSINFCAEFTEECEVEFLTNYIIFRDKLVIFLCKFVYFLAPLTANSEFLLIETSLFTLIF